jgi:hypothetical protein
VAAGARLSSQSWGSVLPFTAGVSACADAWANGLTLDFQGSVVQPGETVTLRNYTVLRLP